MTAKSQLDDGLAYRVPRAAQLLGVCENTCWSLIRQGRLGVVRVGRRVLIPHEELVRFLRANTERVEASRNSVAA